MCDGCGYTDRDGTRECPTCAGCDGTGRGIPCLCGEEIVPEASRVTHDEGEEGSGDGAAVHTPDGCARYTPRDGWEAFVGGGSEPPSWRQTFDGMPDWCEEYIGR